MTESIFIEDDRHSANVLAELRRLGVGLPSMASAAAIPRSAICAAFRSTR
jgi:lambda repressor-like predicted transcriptional regulator